MFFTIEVNNKNIKAEKGETILSALNRNGILIPTLCRMKDFSPTGACRMCVVEVEGHRKLVTACSHPVEEWMKIKTHSPRVINARKTIVELLLSNHPDDCLYCDLNLNCELQRLAEELNIRERRVRSKKIKPRLDQSSPAIVRELSKCIRCGRCVRVCEETVTVTAIDFINKGGHIHVGTAMDRDLNFSSCISCGQCIQVCPTAALHEKHTIGEVQEYLNRPDILKVIQYSPVIPSAIAEEMGIRYTAVFDRVLNAVLRKIGFNRVWNTGTGTDIYISELTDQLLKTIDNKEYKTLFVTACPAWVKYAEQFMPDLIPYLSTLKSPQQITGALIKSLIADNEDIRPENIFSVSATPCTAMKFEAGRDGMMRKGISDVDAVLTAKELTRLIKLYGIDPGTNDQEPFDEPMEGRSSASALAEVSGGITEAVVKTAWHRITKKDPDRSAFRKLRSSGSFRESQFVFGDYEINVAVVDGLTGLEKYGESTSEGKKYNLVEVMVCPGGCINGAGICGRGERELVKNRAKMIYQADESDAVNIPDKSPVLINLNEKLLKKNKETAERKLFHTHYQKRDVLL